MSLIKINNDQTVLNTVLDYENYFEDIFKVIDFPQKWKKEMSFEIEVKKSFLRGLIRYSQSSIKLVERIRKISKEKFDENDNLNWLSLPYPMIHLPGDQIESGVYHYDGKQKNFYTCWIPLINYEYNSLSFFKFQNKFIDLISPILVRSNLCKMLSSQIRGKQGNIFFWTGNHIHKGNLNTSNKTSIAVQFKLTKDVYEYEQTSSMHKTIKENENYINFDKDEIKNLFDEYYQIILDIKQNHNNKDYKKQIKEVLKDFYKQSLPISFALSVLSQRLNTHKKFFNSFYASQEFLEILDLISIAIGSANLISLERLKKKFKNLKDLKELLEDLNIFNSIPFETSQFNLILNKDGIVTEQQFRA